MSVEHVELIVEEPSAEAALRRLLPRLLGSVSFEIHHHQGKNELLERLPARLRGYRLWLPANWRIVVLVDRDDDDCRKLKGRLEKFAIDAGLKTKSTACGGPFILVNRLAVEELEAWHFGDWESVRAVYPKVPATIPRQAAYRDPDAIQGGTWEAFERVLKKAGYFQTGLRKIEAARSIAEHWKPDRNTSGSFQVFCNAVRELAIA